MPLAPKLAAHGAQIPAIGIGTSGLGSVRAEHIATALKAGYRHIDTARKYGTEPAVGEGLRASGVPRGEVFITTKFHPGRADPLAEAEQSLRRLGVDQVDLYLVHWPKGGDPVRAWPGMERSRERGLARSVGVSNYSAKDMAAVILAGTTPPVVNQVQFSPVYYRRALLDAARQLEKNLAACMRAGRC